MIKNRLIGVIIMLVLLPFLFNCNTTFDEDRFVIIDVHFTLQPVTETNRLWAVVFLAPNWTNELFRFSLGTSSIIIPLLKTFNLNDFVGYVAVVYDSTGTGNLLNQQCIGFRNSQFINTATANLDSVAFLEIKTLFIDIDLDTGLLNFPYP